MWCLTQGLPARYKGVLLELTPGGLFPRAAESSAVKTSELKDVPALTDLELLPASHKATQHCRYLGRSMTFADNKTRSGDTMQEYYSWLAQNSN